MKTAKSRPSAASADATHLLAVARLLETRGFVRGVELADRLGLTPAAATRILQRLAQRDGVILYEPYRGVALTDKGRREAEVPLARFKVVFDHLVSIGVGADDAERDAVLAQACLGDESLAAMRPRRGAARKAGR